MLTEPKTVQELVHYLLDKYGESEQLAKVAEECAEMAVEALHLRLSGALARPGAGKALAKECADVEFCCKQVRAILGDDLVDEAWAEKRALVEQKIRDGRL